MFLYHIFFSVLDFLMENIIFLQLFTPNRYRTLKYKCGGQLKPTTEQVYCFKRSGALLGAIPGCNWPRAILTRSPMLAGEGEDCTQLHVMKDDADRPVVNSNSVWGTNLYLSPHCPRPAWPRLHAYNIFFIYPIQFQASMPSSCSM